MKSKIATFLFLFLTSFVYATPPQQPMPIYIDNGDGTVTQTNQQQIINPTILNNQIVFLQNQVTTLNAQIATLQVELLDIYNQVPAIQPKSIQ
jgi:hypothetical protein